MTENKSVDLIYIDPPFNTGEEQRRRDLYYLDKHNDYESFISQHLNEAYRVLKPNGSIMFHIGTKEAHYCKIWLDEIFGRSSFMNEIIWSYDYGGRSKSRWSNKHDTIFWYAKNPKEYTFNYDAIDRIPYLAPALVGAEKAERGKTPTDVWWNTIVHTTGKEKTGYPTQKPLAILERIILVHSNEGDTVMDFFAGSGTTGEAAAKHGRKFILIDNNIQAIDIMNERLKSYMPA
jgi:site-specific DNA-methyltransferase (adenine-specific)